MVYIKGRAKYEHSVTGLFVFASFEAELTITCKGEIAFVMLPVDQALMDKVLRAQAELLEFVIKLKAEINRLQFLAIHTNVPAWD